jgi:hypothetical protein
MDSDAYDTVIFVCGICLHKCVICLQDHAELAQANLVLQEALDRANEDLKERGEEVRNLRSVKKKYMSWAGFEIPQL